MKALRLLTVLLLALTGLARAQVVTTNPVFFTETDPVTIVFDASQGNAGLSGFAGPVYIWTGVITNRSTSPSDWKYVKSSSFGTADPAAEMTSLGNNRWSITLSPNVRAWYGVPAGEQILQLAMIFKNASGSQVGRGPGGSDIFVDLLRSGLGARITAPTGGTQYVASGTTVQVTGQSSASAQLSFQLNGTPVGPTQTGTSLTVPVAVTQTGRNVVRFTATTGSLTASDSLVLVVRPAITVAALPAGAKPDGVTYLNGGTSAILSFSAPNKQFVYVLGEFNNWQQTTAGYMKRTPGTDAATARWWVQIDNLTPGREYAYQFEVDGALRVADPYTEKILDPSNDRFITAATYPGLKAYPTGQTTGIVSVLQSNQTAYQWTTTGYQRPKKTDLVVYELHLRDFLQRHDFRGLRDTLGYLQRLGITAIELMPVNEFEGNDSWGYNPSFYFAVDKYYGPKDDLKRLIDECHRRGMAVILDMVLNHSCGQSPMVQMYFDGGNPATNSPWFNRTATHPFNVCYDFNHESPYTKYFSKRVMEFWLQEFRIDGYRFDLSKGFTQTNTGSDVGQWSVYDQSRINIWLDYQSHIRSVDPNAFIILEHFADNAEETVLANAGMMLWGNVHGAYGEAIKGFQNNSNLNAASYLQRGFQQPNLVAYMESHDEERQMVGALNGGNTTNPAHNVRRSAVALARNEMAATFLLATPGPKMIWEFGELGYDVSINFNGRTGAKPIRWDYYDSLNRRKLYNVYAAMNALRVQQPAFESNNYAMNTRLNVKTLRITDPSMNVVVVGNFGVLADSVLPGFQSTGRWYNYLRGDSITVTNVNARYPLQPGEYAVYTSRRVARPATVLTTKAAQQVAALGLTVAPNPAASLATVRLTMPTAAPLTVSVRNVIGREVRRVQLPARPAGAAVEVPLTLDGLAAGLYLVNVQAGGASATTRLVVQR